MRALIAPDAFKGTFSAAQVAAAIGRGLEAEGVEADLCPVADGGEGTLSVLLTRLGGETRGAAAHDPLGRPRAGGFALLEDGGTALVEVAEVGGLHLVGDPTPSTAWEASSRGTGELIVAAAREGAAVVLVAAGGSASTDGGAGAVAAIEAAGGLQGAQLVVLCDVTTPWEDCARIFGPQKGADGATVTRLQARLDRLAEQLAARSGDSSTFVDPGTPNVDERVGRDPRGVASTGAAGGLSGGLWSAFGAVLEPGAPFVLDALDVDERLARADAVIVGEGRLDGQSLDGKVPGELAARARAAGVPCHAIVGSLGDGDRSSLASIRIASDVAALEAAGAELAAALRHAG